MSIRRQPSAPWSRLKPVVMDPLESVGLPSKGDTRLLNHKAQESYFNKIVDRYMEFCAAAGREDDKLDKAFASLSVQEHGRNGKHIRSGSHDWASAPREELDLIVRRTSTTASTPPSSRSGEDPPRGLSVIMMAMRKLREALLAAGRTDAFAQRAYIFITRAAILTSSYESYQPALLHLLYRVHPVTPLSVSELREFIGYQILDLACRLGQFGEAFSIRHRWDWKDARIEAVLWAVVRDDWVKFWRCHGEVDGYQRRLMGWAEDQIRKHALKCLGKSYLSIDKIFVEQSTGRPWEELREKDGVGWELEGNKVIVKKVKKK